MVTLSCAYGYLLPPPPLAEQAAQDAHANDGASHASKETIEAVQDACLAALNAGDALTGAAGYEGKSSNAAEEKHEPSPVEDVCQAFFLLHRACDFGCGVLVDHISLSPEGCTEETKTALYAATQRAEQCGETAIGLWDLLLPRDEPHVLPHGTLSCLVWTIRRTAELSAILELVNGWEEGGMDQLSTASVCSDIAPDPLHSS